MNLLKLLFTDIFFKEKALMTNIVHMTFISRCRHFNEKNDDNDKLGFSTFFFAEQNEFDLHLARMLHFSCE